VKVKYNGIINWRFFTSRLKLLKLYFFEKKARKKENKNKNDIIF
jgi:hypothetical protein